MAMLRSGCATITRRNGNPFAIATLMCCVLSSSIIEDRTTIRMRVIAGTASVSAGKMRWLTSPLPEVGSHRKSTANSRMRSRPNQNCGTDRPMRLSTTVMRSAMLPKALAQIQMCDIRQEIDELNIKRTIQSELLGKGCALRRGGLHRQHG